MMFFIKFEIQNNMYMKNIELEFANFRNSYSKGGLFVELNFPFPFKENELSIELLSPKELGAFFHEYIHFYQNIATTFGLIEGGIILQRIANTFSEVANTASKKISIPYLLKQNPDESQEYRLEQKIGEVIKNDDYNICIDGKDIKYDFEGNNSVIVEFKNTKNNTYIRRRVGTWDLKEGMAARCQSLIDPNNQQPDIPYNILWILCQKKFPNITPKKFICICYCSLFYIDPIIEFFKMCESYNVHTSLDIKSIFENEIKKNYPIYIYKKNVYTEYMKSFLRCEIPYIEGILKKMDNLPLIDLIDNGLTVNNIKKFIQEYGSPLIRSFNNSHYEWHFPGLENKQPAGDVVVLRGKYMLYDYITGKSPCCQFLSECPNKQDDCYDNKLWQLENDCIFKKIWNNCGFDGIKVVKDSIIH